MTGPDDRNEGDRAWERVDARILGQLLSAQNLLFVLPDDARIGEFFTQALTEVPGVLSCSVCLGDSSAPRETAECQDCSRVRAAAGDSPGLARSFTCPLGEQEGGRVIRVGTGEHTFGFFVFRLDSTEVFDPYLPFVANLASYVALSLETRLQRRVIERARDDLELRVKERTQELREANALLAAEIQERKIAQHDLHESNERFVLAGKAAGLGVWDWNLTENRILWDDRMYALYGLRREDCPDVYEAWLRSLHPADGGRHEQLMAFLAGPGRSYESEFRIFWPDGSLHYLKSFGEVERNAEGRAVRMTGVNLDVTVARVAENEIHRLNQELEQRVSDRTAELEQANRELEAFAYSVSHDLRAPLRHIDGFVGLLKKRMGNSLDEQSEHYMQTIHGAVRRMGILIDDLLSFSRMGRSEMTRTQVDMNAMVQSIIKESEPEAQGRFIRWDVSDLPPVIGDRAMLQVVFTNLVSNALKFTRPRPEAEITVGCLPDAEREVILYVRDNGVGFDMKYADKLFGVFQRLHSVEEFEGTGIGLANVRRVIQRHGGRVWAESAVDEGATFYVALPRGRPAGAEGSQV